MALLLLAKNYSGVGALSLPFSFFWLARISSRTESSSRLTKCKLFIKTCKQAIIEHAAPIFAGCFMKNYVDGDSSLYSYLPMPIPLFVIATTTPSIGYLIADSISIISLSILKTSSSYQPFDIPILCKYSVSWTGLLSKAGHE